ncbi:MAG: hypothetical protein CMB99_05800 [Flavobacteriaceae bacterium]|nr:hypothetical protein [Flavobacteriaceae bacterium]|tara:strand:+ start:24967 stop:25983 length:1017 start_codon:yes stop_codon:yes gene_type:complete
MMNKIAYLFGAGASRNALPIVNEIEGRLREFIDVLKEDNLQLSDQLVFDDLEVKGLKSKQHYQNQLINDLEWLLKESSRHASVDTFARKLTIKNEFEKLKKLKICLSIFFVYEQTINAPDERYDSFFAAIHNELSELPKNIQILSWNYDYQFELSYLEYSNSKDLTTMQTILNVNHKFGNNHTRDKFGIYKLNGSIGLYSRGGWKQYQYVNTLNDPIDIVFVNQIVRKYTAALTIRDLHSNFSFSWENEASNDSIVDLAIEATKDVIALVVIGYSFPFFNREIDRKIIGAMTNLKRVYFQAPDADILIERFQAIKDNTKQIDLVPKKDLEQFVLPNEL